MGGLSPSALRASSPVPFKQFSVSIMITREKLSVSSSLICICLLPCVLLNWFLLPAYSAESLETVRYVPDVDTAGPTRFAADTAVVGLVLCAMQMALLHFNKRKTTDGTWMLNKSAWLRCILCAGAVLGLAVCVCLSIFTLHYYTSRGHVIFDDTHRYGMSGTVVKITGKLDFETFVCTLSAPGVGEIPQTTNGTAPDDSTTDHVKTTARMRRDCRIAVARRWLFLLYTVSAGAYFWYWYRWAGTLLLISLDGREQY